MSIALSRSAWGARAPKCLNHLRIPTPELFVHHEGSPFNSDQQAQEEATMRAIQTDHMDNRGWCDIAYSFVVFPSGRAYVGRGWGVEGGATFGHNASSHAICWAGNMMVQRPTGQSLDTGVTLIAEGKAGGFLASLSAILGHRDASGGYPENQTQCPGDHLEAELPFLRQGGGGGTDMGSADDFFDVLAQQKATNKYQWAANQNYLNGWRAAATHEAPTVDQQADHNFMAGYSEHSLLGAGGGGGVPLKVNLTGTATP